MNNQNQSKYSFICFISLEVALVLAGLMSIQYWRDCFIWGHFCTHSPLEALLKIYCGAAAPLAFILLFTRRLFLSLSFAAQLISTFICIVGVLASAWLYCSIYIY